MVNTDLGQFDPGQFGPFFISFGQFGPRENKVRIDQGSSGVKVRIDQCSSGIKVRIDQGLSAVKVGIDQSLNSVSTATNIYWETRSEFTKVRIVHNSLESICMKLTDYKYNVHIP